ncbi:ROK family protein [Rhizobium sp. PAMB 3174]
MIVCFDIGGTAIKGALAHSPDDVRPLGRRPTPTNDYTAFVDTLRSVIAETGERPDCVAISNAGSIDPDTGAIICANIPCINGRRLAADLTADLGVEVLIANDADCFALAEALAGAGRGYHTVFGIILGTGVGGGVVVKGKLINERGGYAGEWGHGPAAPHFAGHPPAAIPAIPCGCGGERCLDPIGSARGMERLHRHLHATELTSEQIVAAWQAGDAQASRTIEVFVDILAGPLALIVNLLGADIIPAGGGLSNSEALLAELDRSVRAKTLRAFDRPLVLRCECRVEPGLIGAAQLGFARLQEKAEALPA